MVVDERAVIAERERERKKKWEAVRWRLSYFTCRTLNGLMCGIDDGHMSNRACND